MQQAVGDGVAFPYGGQNDVFLISAQLTGQAKYHSPLPGRYWCRGPVNGQCLSTKFLAQWARKASPRCTLKEEPAAVGR